MTDFSASKAPLWNGLITVLLDVAPSGKINSGDFYVTPASISVYLLQILSTRFCFTSAVPPLGQISPSPANTNDLRKGKSHT